MIMLVHFRLVSRKYILTIQLQFCRDLVTIIVFPGFGSSGVYYFSGSCYIHWGGSY